MARARFDNLESPAAEIFVVKISGHLGAKERPAVEGLLRRCRETDRLRLAVELSELQSLGGTVAKQFGTWAAEVAASGAPFCVVGASDTVRSVLEARCADVAPIFVDRLEDLSSAFALPAPTQPSAKSTPVPDEPETEAETAPSGPVPTVTATVAPESEAEDAPEDEIEALLDQTLAFDGTESPKTGPIRSLAQAQSDLARAGDLREAARVVIDLLRGSELLEEVSLFCLQDDGFLFVKSTVLRSADFFIPATGALVETLRRLDEPVPRLELAEKLSEDEKRIFDALRSDLAIPLFVGHELQAIAVVGTRRADYEKAEILALDLLARHIGHGIHRQGLPEDGAPSEKEQELGRQLRRQRTVLRLCREIHSIEAEDRLLSRLLISLIGEMGISGAVFYAAEGKELHPRHVYGLEESRLPTLAPPRFDAVSGLEETLSPIEADAEDWGTELSQLAELGVDLLVPLRGPRHFFGVLALAVRRSRDEGLFDPGYLEALLHQAGLAAEHLRTVQELEDQTLEVAKTLITLVEQRAGAGGTGRTEMIARYVQRVAEQLDHDPDDCRDLLYGSVLRDIGMIEIGDLVLKSPRSLSEEEWEQVQGHPQAGAKILERMGFSSHTCEIVQHHHERFNGRGYPAGLRGDAIPLGARIVSVVESYVAMIHDLPYRPALPETEALDVLRENWEMRYDPRVIDAFLQVLSQEKDRRDANRRQLDDILSS